MLLETVRLHGVLYYRFQRQIPPLKWCDSWIRARDVATHGEWHVTGRALRLRAPSSAHRLPAAAVILPGLWKKVLAGPSQVQSWGGGLGVAAGWVGKDTGFRSVVIPEPRSGA